jgi:hypothetical protein
VTFEAPERPTVWSLLTIDMYMDQARNVRLAQGVTANLFVRRELFAALGGFDESLPSGGDYDFARRSVEHGGRLVYSAAAIVRHPTIDTRAGFLRKVYATTRWATARRVRDGRRPAVSSALYFVPVLGVGLARHRALQPPTGLPLARLESCGVRASRPRRACAVVTFHAVVGAVGGAAKVAGWLHGRRLAAMRREVGARDRGDAARRTAPSRGK